MSAAKADAPPAAAYLVKGDDASLVAQATRELLGQLVGERDAGLVVEEFGGSSGDDLDIGTVIDAMLTPSLLVDRRVVVVRDAGRIGAADVTRLVGALGTAQPSASLVLVSGAGTIPAALVKAVTAGGGLVETAVGRGRDRQAWIREQASAGDVTLDAASLSLVDEHLGEDLGRLSGLLATLASAYGSGAAIGVEDLRPYLGEAGTVPPWDLTDAIDAGRTEEALDVLHRMTEAGGRAGPELIVILHRHFSAMLRLDGSDVTSGEEAAALLGLRSAYPAKKALAQAKKLGSERIAQAIGLIADADLDVKGMSALDHEVLLEVLVARLSRLTRTRAAVRR